MTSSDLVLSLFPGVGLLDQAFEEAGYCVVRGPDVLWGGDVRRFSPPAGVFAGIIGGPPCQSFSSLAHLVRAQGREPRFGNLIPEFERCVLEAGPSWFLMENVRDAPVPAVAGYQVQCLLLNNRWVGGPVGAEQNRLRRFSFGTHDGRELQIEYAALEAPQRYVAVTADLRVTPVAIGRSGKRKKTAAVSPDAAGRVHQVRYTYAEACRLQGLSEDFLQDAPFTAAGKLKAVANGVPLPMGRAIAQAVRRAMGTP